MQILGCVCASQRPERQITPVIVLTRALSSTDNLLSDFRELELFQRLLLPEQAN
jgi:hypothetical protein